MGGISLWQLIVVAIIVVLLFGTKKLRSLGSDLGSAVKGFKDAVDSDADSASPHTQHKQSADQDKRQE